MANDVVKFVDSIAASPTTRLDLNDGTTFTLGAAIVAPLAAAFKGMLDRSTEIAKLSTKLGVSTEQLSEFAYAAELTGQSFQDLEGHWENLAERVAQGATGGGEAAETFKKLGIDAGQLKLQNPVEQLITLAEAMRGVTNETERLGMLSSLGGDKFQGLNALFKQGPEGIRKMMGEAKTVGASVSSESAAAAVKTEQAFLRAWTSIKSIFWSVGEAFLPLVDTLQAGVSLFVGLIEAAPALLDAAERLAVVEAERDALAASVARVREGHTPHPDYLPGPNGVPIRWERCQRCNGAYPCQPIRALDGSGS